MRVAFVGDLHCRIKEMYEKVQKEQGLVDVIFQVGDFGTFLDPTRLDRMTVKWDGFISDFSEYCEGLLEAPVLTYFVKGNHEDFDFLQEHEHDNEVARNIIYLPNKSIITPDGKTSIGALGGNWSWKNYPRQKRELSGDNRKYFNYQDVDFFKSHPVDILLLHECPRGVLERHPDRGSPRLTELIEEMQPRYAFHGHHHTFNQATIDRTQVIGLGTIYGKEQSVYVLEF